MNDSIMACLAKEYDLTTQPRELVVYRCAAIDLLNESKMKHLLALYTPLVKGKEQAVGEAYMTGWFRGPTMGLLYALSAWNKSINLSLHNITIEIYKNSYNDIEYYSCGFLLSNVELEDGPQLPLDNSDWVTEKLGHYFQHTVRPIFESIAKVGSLKIGMLWSQLPTSFEYSYELLLKSDKSDEVKLQTIRNYKLMKSLDGQRFGRKNNPLDVKFRLTESMDCPDKQIRMKYTCCQYYLVEDGYYCFTCPKIRESEREERRMAFRSENQKQ
ncbi:ferric iron reductase protein FhuF [Paenibacillus castaneae]|uniref:hypothetical protein n=1 Tax=Paenibacillus castaneae TaxID=474957 RepID=UPI000C99857F|nr:hypothetical protein [Paenibacillus castaneae]NIK78422.1 ferric iron reductase protein FhuF [Paenibacillus castaneae]